MCSFTSLLTQYRLAEHLLCTQMEWGDRDAIELTTHHPSPLLLLLFKRITGRERSVQRWQQKMPPRLRYLGMQQSSLQRLGKECAARSQSSGGRAAAEALETGAEAGCKTGSLCRMLQVTLMSLTFILSKHLEGLKLDRETVDCLLK